MRGFDGIAPLNGKNVDHPHWCNVLPASSQVDNLPVNNSQNLIDVNDLSVLEWLILFSTRLDMHVHLKMVSRHMEFQLDAGPVQPAFYSYAESMSSIGPQTLQT